MPPISARLSPAMQVVTTAVRKAGRRLLRDFGEVEQLQVSVKGPSDFVSTADLRAEQTLREELTKARPAFAFLMEESGASGSEDWDWRWVVDPLDGTTNFLHGIPHWAISVGIEKRIAPGRTEIMAGVIYNPASDELFWAEKGVGAFLNDKRLRVSGRREMKDAVFATGIPFGAVPRKADVLVVAGFEDEAHGSGPPPGRPKADLGPLGGQRVHEVTSVEAHWFTPSCAASRRTDRSA
jgi:myo-inositol-1(or 4)-monophosphatase